LLWLSSSIGVDRIIVYDDTPIHDKGVGSVLGEHVRSGFVEVIDAHQWNNTRFLLSSDITIGAQHRYAKSMGGVGRLLFFDKQQKMQLDTWRRLLRRPPAGVGKDTHVWLGNLDDDEFLNPKTRPLKSILRDVRLKGARSLRYAKLDFGTSGFRSPPEADLRSSYVMRDPSGEKHAGLALVSAITGMAPGCTHVFGTNSMIADLARGSHECNDWHGDGYPGQVRYGVYYNPIDEMAINHYRTKSYAECKRRECIRHPDGQYAGRDCLQPKDVCDDTILQHVRGERASQMRAGPCGSAAGVQSIHDRVRGLARHVFADSHHFSLWNGTWHYVPACNSQSDHNWDVCRRLNRSSRVILCNDRKHGADHLWVPMSTFDACIRCVEEGWSLTTAAATSAGNDTTAGADSRCAALFRGKPSRYWKEKWWNECELVAGQVRVAEDHLANGHIFGRVVRIER